MIIALEILRLVCMNVKPQGSLKEKFNSYIANFTNRNLSLNATILKILSTDKENFKKSVEFFPQKLNIQEKDLDKLKEIIQLKSAKYFNQKSNVYEFYTKEGIDDYKTYGFYFANENYLKMGMQEI